MIEQQPDAPDTSYKDHSPTLDEQAGHCFACGPANPEGLHLKFVYDAEHQTATAPVHLTRIHEGPPGYIHGGIVAALLDEAMSKLNRPLNALAMTRHMEVDYLRPAPLFEDLTVIGKHVSRSQNQDGTPGRKLFHSAELRSAAGDVLARSKGLFIVLDAAMVAAAKSRLSPPPAD